MSKGDGKEKSLESKGKSKGQSKGSEGAKRSCKGETSKIGLFCRENPTSETSSELRNLHRRIPLTILTRTILGVMMAGVTMTGMMTLSPHALFHLQVLILVP